MAKTPIFWSSFFHQSLTTPLLSCEHDYGLPFQVDRVTQSRLGQVVCLSYGKT